MQVHCNKLIVNMNDNKGNVHALVYNIFNTPVAKKWIDIINDNIQAKNKIKTNLQNMSVTDIDTLREKLDNCVSIINEHYDKQLPLHGDVAELNTEILNYLHEEFEVYGDRIEDLTITNPVDWWNTQLHDAFLQLNNYIHNYEDVMYIKEQGGFPHMAGLFDYLPAGDHSKLEDADYLYMTTDFRWGGIYLGYNTLGKDFLGVSKDNDMEVLDRDQVRPQKHFAAESWINFNSDAPSSPWNLIKWDAWYQGLTPEQQVKVPVDSRSQLGLGRIWVGNINLEVLPMRESIEPNLEKWSIPNSEARSRWNTEVFSTFTDVHSIEIQPNDNMFTDFKR